MNRTPLALLLAALVVLGACGTTDDPAVSGDAETGGEPAEDAAAAFPVTITAANGQVTIEARPERIVSLSPTTTEMLFAVGAGDQVIAADEQSNFPPEVPTTDLSGFSPNIEAIAGHDPDLVVLSHDLGDLLDGLDALGIPVILLPAADTLDDTYAQLEQLGAVTGNLADAAAVVAGMQAEIEAILAGLPELDEPLSYYHELDDTFFSATSATFIGRVYALAGLENIADAVADSPFPQLSAEYIIDADPDFIFLADVKCCGESAETVAARPGWDSLGAVQRGQVIELDDDIASRWGPRIVEQLRVVVGAVIAAREPVQG